MRHIDLWAWFKQPLKQEPRNDHERELRAIVQLYYQGRQYLEDDPEQSVIIFEDARRRAEMINEPCYALFYGYQVCEVCLYYIRDTVRSLDYATRLIAATRHQKYHHCASLGDLYHAVVTAYLIIDPVGYVGEIENSLTYLEMEVPLTHERRCIIVSNRSVLAYELDQVDDAISLALKYLELSEGYFYRQYHAYLMLCEYAYNLNEVELAYEHICNAEANLMKLKKPLVQAAIDISAWKAVLELRRGFEKHAHQSYRRAVTKLQDFGRDPWPMYCTHIAEYLEMQGKIDQAVRLYEQTSYTVLGTGKHWSICEFWLERCRFMGRAGLPFDGELKSAYEAGGNLLRPDSYLAKLKRVEAGDYSSRKVKR